MELSLWLPRVNEAFPELEDNAERLIKGEEVVCDLTPDGYLDQLAQQAAELGAEVPSGAFRRPKPYTKKHIHLLDPDPLPKIFQALTKQEFDIEYDPNPLTIFAQAVAALQWLAQCREPEPSELVFCIF